MRRPSSSITAVALAMATAAVAQPGEPGGFDRLTPEAVTFDIGTEVSRRASGVAGIRARIAARAVVEVGYYEGVPYGNRPIRIYFEAYVNKREHRGAIVLSSGRTEGAVLYREFILDALNNGFSVYVSDHRGQGFSSRLLQDPGEETKGHVDQFDHYVRDLRSFIELVKARRDTARPMYLVGHSMGAAIGARLIETQADHGFTRAAFVTPMFEPTVAGAAATRTERIEQAYCTRGALDAWLEIPAVARRFAEGDTFDAMYAAYRTNRGREPSDLTGSAWRLDANWRARASRCVGFHCGHGDAKVGGPTLRWFNQACHGAQEARGTDARRIRIPVLVLQGEFDTVVEPAAQVAFCREVNHADDAAPLCTGRVITRSRHAALIEADPIRRATLQATFGFLTRRSAEPAAADAVPAAASAAAR